MARTSHKEAPPLSVVHDNTPAESATVDDARQTDIEAAITEAHEHAAGAGVAASVAPAVEIVPTPARRGRKPGSGAGVPRKSRAAAVSAGPKMVPAPVPVGTVPQAPMTVSAALAMIAPGTEMTILGATWQEVNAAADELGIRAFIWTKPPANGVDGVDVNHRLHGGEADTDTE